MIYRLNNMYYVRGLREADLSGGYISWFEDQTVCKYNSHGKLLHGEQHYRDFVLNSGDQNSLVWAVCSDADGHIGNASLNDISLINRSAEFSIILGDQRHYGRGVGKAVARVLLKHAFQKLNLHRVYCGTAATNRAMRKLALSLGMREEGCRRKQLWLDGNWEDVIEYGILVDEFFDKAG
jgi:RimJ/RimL family protein N-acetyltransferase